jgi:hypothetical protein
MKHIYRPVSAMILGRILDKEMSILSGSRRKDLRVCHKSSCEITFFSSHMPTKFLWASPCGRSRLRCRRDAL